MTAFIVLVLLFVSYVITNGARVKSLERRLAELEALEQTPTARNVRKQLAWLDNHPGLQ